MKIINLENELDKGRRSAGGMAKMRQGVLATGFLERASDLCIMQRVGHILREHSRALGDLD